MKAFCCCSWPLSKRSPRGTSTLARGAAYEIDFETEEGTFMSVDGSPDGRYLVFDLLADIYRVPVERGPAECLTADRPLGGR